jgi:hypothetical protein
MDKDALFAAALQATAKKVVVKSPDYALPLGGKPAESFKSKLLRYAYAGADFTSPVLIQNRAPCRGQIISSPSNSPLAISAPSCVHISSINRDALKN